MSLGQDGPPTRTRMPEGHGGHGTHGAGRRPDRPRRALVTVVTVVVLLIAAIAFAGRSGHHSGDSSSGAPSATTSGSSGSSGTSGGKGGTPTAATGVPPVTAKSSGIPSGFAHTGQGAQSAAANYAVALGGTDMFNAGARHRIVGAVYAADAAGASLSALDKAYTNPAFLQRIGLRTDGTAPAGLVFVSRTDPAGARLDAFNGDTATVSVWYSSLFGLAGEGSTNPVTESWYTNTFDLKWTSGDWKITGFRQKDGPTPVGRDQAASSAKDMSDAVNGFGGFTYAR